MVLGPSLMSGGFGEPGEATAMTSLAGAAVSAVGAFYAVDSQRYNLRTRALNLDFQGSMSNLNAELAEREAAFMVRAARQQRGGLTLRFGQIEARARVEQAGAGVQAGVGSAAEVQASIAATKEIEALTVDINAMRAVHGARLRSVNARNLALLSRVSAHNVRSFAGNLSPGLALATSLLGSAGPVASQFISQSGPS